MIIYRKNRAGV